MSPNCRNAIVPHYIQGGFFRDIDIGQEIRVDPAFHKALEWDTCEIPFLESAYCYSTGDSVKSLPLMRMKWVPIQLGIKGIVAAHGIDGLLELHTWGAEADSRMIYRNRSGLSGSDEIL